MKPSDHDPAGGDQHPPPDPVAVLADTRHGVRFGPTSADATAARLHKALFYLDRKVSAAVRRYGLIADGDRVFVALSGGKDSWALLEVLAARRVWAREAYELCACHVRIPGCTSAAGEATMAARCSSLGVPFTALAAPRGDETAAPDGARCHRCSRARRRLLFEEAARVGATTVALGHHLDDFAETVLLNAVFQGHTTGMPPRREMFGGRFALIRPLILVDEKDLARVCRLAAAATGLPLPDPAACLGVRTERDRMKAFLADVRRVCPGVKRNLLRVGGFADGDGF